MEFHAHNQCETPRRFHRVGSESRRPISQSPIGKQDWRIFTMKTRSLLAVPRTSDSYTLAARIGRVARRSSGSAPGACGIGHKTVSPKSASSSRTSRTDKLGVSRGALCAGAFAACRSKLRCPRAGRRRGARHPALRLPLVRVPQRKARQRRAEILDAARRLRHCGNKFLQIMAR